MGIRADLLAVEITDNEEATVKAGAAKAFSLRANQDAAVKGVDDLERIIQEVHDKCPSGSNKTALAAVLTALA